MFTEVACCLTPSRALIPSGWPANHLWSQIQGWPGLQNRIVPSHNLHMDIWRHDKICLPSPQPGPFQVPAHGCAMLLNFALLPNAVFFVQDQTRCGLDLMPPGKLLSGGTPATSLGATSAFQTLMSYKLHNHACTCCCCWSHRPTRPDGSPGCPANAPALVPLWMRLEDPCLHKLSPR